MWLRYLTNGPEFDFPPFAKLPPVRYVLASTQRYGSNTLARAIWIQRRDRLGQAISYTMAEQTGAWILDGTYLPLRETVAEPRYSYADIRRHLLLLDHGVTAWEEYFDRRNLSP